MLEKVVESIHTESSPQKIRAFFSLLDSLFSPEDKAESLAKLAEALAVKNPIEALKALQSANRLCPQNDVVLSSAEKVLTQLNRSGSASKLALLKKRAPFSADLKAESSIGNEVTRANTALHSPSAEIQNISPISDNLPQVNESLTSVPQLATMKMTFSSAQAPSSYTLFSMFLQDAELNYGWLEFAEGFTDNLLGLIHFVNFLREENKISGESLLRSIETLKKYVAKPDTEIRCRVRFFELFESHHEDD